MKILLLTNKMPYPANDGGTIATLAMIRGFQQSGVQLTVLAMNTPKHNFNLENLPQELRQNIDWHTCYVDTRLKPQEILINLFFSNLPYNAKRFISKTYKTKLKEILISQEFDIIQLEGLFLYPYISTIRKYSKALISMRAHNVEHEIWKRKVQNQSPSIQRVYNRLLSVRMQKMEKRSLKNFDLLITITERDAHIFDFLGNRAPYFVVPVGVDLNDYPIKEENPNLKLNTLYFIGALDWMPNQEGIYWFISKVWQKILAQCPDTEFHIAGRNAPSDFIHRVNRKNIVFHGQVDNAQEFSRHYNIMITPLLTGSGMRVKIVEAMAMKKPVVATKIAAEGIPAINSKHMFIAYNENEFADYVVQLLKNPHECNIMGEYAQQLVESQFNNPVLISRLLEFYENKLNKHR